MRGAAALGAPKRLPSVAGAAGALGESSPRLAAMGIAAGTAAEGPAKAELISEGAAGVSGELSAELSVAGAPGCGINARESSADFKRSGETSGCAPTGGAPAVP